MNKHDLITKIKQLEGLTQDERATLIELVNTKKKYGLVWEDKPEDVEEQLRTQLPVLREVAEKRILGKELPREIKVVETKQPDLFSSNENQVNQVNSENQGSDSFPNHILIEGDNLHALTALTFTHEGRIDVIYIDPPYNTGNKDFKYNDSFVDREDSYRHSKWLSFMDKRLRIAKRLLSEKGVIFISIDDNEQAQLKILCDEVFGENHFIRNVIWHKKYAASSDSKGIPDMHDFVLVYSKADSFTRNLLPRSGKQDDLYKYDSHDGKGLWRSDNLSVKTYNESYDFDLVNPNTGIVYRPPRGRAWITNKDRIAEWIAEGRIFFGQKGDGAPQLKRYLNEVQAGVVPTSYWGYDEVGHNDSSRKELKEILFDRADGGFSTPKPTALIKRALIISSLKSSIILDFFAGSGTTLHATMQLNAEDGGNRQCILVTNNENNICEEVTYQRNKRVIQGYSNSKGQWVSGLTNNNLRYYRSEFTGREPSLKNKRQLTQLATALLCIKEDCYEEQAVEGIKNIRYFSENEKHFVVVYDDTAIESAVEFIKDQVASQNIQENGIKVYVFSPGQYPFTEEFEEVLPYVKLCALPDAIYKAYMNVLPKRTRKSAPVLEDEEEENNQPNLFE